MSELHSICHCLNEYLKKHSWIFNYSNVKIMQERHRWPKEWCDFIHKTSTSDLKKIFNGDDSEVPNFVKEFVDERNSLLHKVEALIVGDYIPLQENHKDASEYRRRMNQIKRGMSVKKQHEVLRLGPFIEKANNSTQDNGFDHIVDVGSGAGHLERYLLKMTDTINPKQIICVESSQSHVESSIKLARDDEDLQVQTIKAIVKNEI